MTEVRDPPRYCELPADERAAGLAALEASELEADCAGAAAAVVVEPAGRNIRQHQPASGREAANFRLNEVLEWWMVVQRCV